MKPQQLPQQQQQQAALPPQLQDGKGDVAEGAADDDEEMYSTMVIRDEDVLQTLANNANEVKQVRVLLFWNSSAFGDVLLLFLGGGMWGGICWIDEDHIKPQRLPSALGRKD